MPGHAISHRFAPNAWVSHRTCARAGRQRQAEVMDLQAAGVEFIDEFRDVHHQRGFQSPKSRQGEMSSSVSSNRDATEVGSRVGEPYVRVIWSLCLHSRRGMSTMANTCTRGSAPGRAQPAHLRPDSFKEGHEKRGGALRHPQIFCSLLMNLLPLEIAEGDAPEEPRRTIEESNQRVRDYIGLTGKDRTKRQTVQVESPWSWTGQPFPVGSLMHGKSEALLHPAWRRLVGGRRNAAANGLPRGFSSPGLVMFAEFAAVCCKLGTSLGSR
jgi:hypothetical protein